MKTTTKPKDKYKVTNWNEYNKSLCNRGNITMWINQGIIDNWYYKGKRKPGGELQYSDAAIELSLTLRAIYNLAYRQTEGFVASIMAISGFDLSVPCYTQIQRRSKQLPVNIKVRQHPKGSLDIVLDSTGLKVYGEGEWKVHKHGKDKNRTWRKIHLGSDAGDLEILSVVVTSNDIDDAAAGVDILGQITEDIKSCAGDGAYDKSKFRGCLPEKIKQLIPPQRNAVLSKKNDSKMQQRDQAIRAIKDKGRAEWKKQVGYHKRSLSEVNMFRYKTIFTGDLKARKPEYEETEVKIKCKILNQFIQLGMPKSVKVAA